MSEEITKDYGSLIVTPPINLCYFCKENCDGMTVYRRGEATHLKYMLEPDTSAHFECYIHECVRQSLEKLKKA